LILARHRIGENVAFRFRVAGDGGEAMALIEGHSFDAAIVDMYLPVLDGGAVIARIRKNQLTQFIPVIAISAGGRDAADAALAAGADRFLAKPVRLREIADALKVLAGL
jgi:CheY-like chemotaxis protein